MKKNLHLPPVMFELTGFSLRKAALVFCVLDLKGPKELFLTLVASKDTQTEPVLETKTKTEICCFSLSTPSHLRDISSLFLLQNEEDEEEKKEFAI